jgi:hypothetical protein
MKNKKKSETAMKTKIFSIILLLLAVTTTAPSFARANSNTPKTNSYEAIELNRLIGLASDNTGLRVSCAFNLGEMKSQKAVIPLMQLLREGSTEEERIIAALSLIKIGDAQGVYMVGRSGIFNDSEKTRRMCGKFYQSFLIHQYLKTQLGQPEESNEVSLNF